MALLKDKIPVASADSEYLHIFENANIGVYRSNPDGLQIRANPHLVALNGFNSEEEQLASVVDIATEWYVDPNRRSEFKTILHEQGKVDNFESEIYRQKTKERIWISENAWVVRDPQGNIIYYEGTVEDITQRKQHAIFQETLIQFIEDTLKQGIDEGFYQRLLERTVDVVPGAQAGSILIQGPDNAYHFVAAVGFDLPDLQISSLAPEELFEVDLQSSNPQIIRHEGHYKTSNTKHQENYSRLKASLVVPIFHNHQRALLFLDNFEIQDAFNETAQAMASGFAQQVAVLIKHLSLENNLQLRQKSLENWSVFHNGLSQTVSDILQFGVDQDFYQRLLSQAISAIPNVDAGSILLLKEDQRYHFAAAVGYFLPTLQKITFAKHEVFASTATPLLATDISNLNNQTLDPTRCRLLEKSGSTKDIKMVISVPVCINGNVVAGLNLDSFKEDAFNQETLEMASAFASQIGILLQRIHLEHQLEHTNSKLVKLANFDNLTGLPNRLLFADRLEQSFVQARRTGDLVGLLYLDLDGFKDVNDSLGHSMGDALLKTVASRLSSCLREEDTIARLGGDEFAIVLNALQDPQDAAKIAQKLLDSFSASFNIQGYDLYVGVSIGISFYPNDGYTLDDILKHADTAMYQAKTSGKNRFHFFTPELNQKILEQIKLESDMRRGLERGEFALHYQPRVHLQTNQIDSVEALLRWKHPSLGFVSPMIFIPLAEKTDFISALTVYVLQEACAQAKLWQAEGRMIRVAVNLSAKSLQQADILSMVHDVLELHQLDAKYLELEITESAAMADVENTIKTLNKIKNMGVHISIDDFGTAYSSLNYLKRLPINCLKIDRSFVKDISLESLDSPDAAIVKAIVALAKSMGFRVIAEGVETQDQVVFLQFLGCDEAQGYFFYKPIPPEKLFKTEGALVKA
jgi:diguanylate cyclase (GGDEF)-like protein/PAS domain S-box-containing protein